MLYITFNAQIEDETTNRLIEEVSKGFNEGEKELTLLFNTPGGRVSNGITTHNFLKTLKMKKIFWNIGNIDSIGVMMFLAGDERYCMPHSRFLLHDIGRTVFQAPITFTQEQIELWIKGMEQDRNAIASLIAERISQSKEKIIEMMKRGEILTTEEAKNLNFIQKSEKKLEIPQGIKMITIVSKEKK